MGVPRSSLRAFTLIEMMVVVAVIALLTAVLLPSMAKARRAAWRTTCLHNMKSLEQAHWLYMTANKGYLIRVGLMHGDHDDKPEVAWFNTLRHIFKDRLAARSPVDDSPHSPTSEGGLGVPVAGKRGYPFRRTSYGINNYLDVEKAPEVNGARAIWNRIETVPNPSAVVHFLFMVKACNPDNPCYEPDECLAASDHPHVEEWAEWPDIPTAAANQLEIQAHGGPKWSKASISNYGFLDDHAESLPFEKVYQNTIANKFDPGLQLVSRRR